MIVVDTVPFLADAVLENVDELSGNIALVGRDTDESQSRTGRKVTYPEKVERAFEAGAVGVIVVNTPRGGKDGDDLSRMGSDTGNYKSKIPVLMIKSSDAARLRKRGCAVIRDKGAPVVAGFGHDGRFLHGQGIWSNLSAGFIDRRSADSASCMFREGLRLRWCP